MRHVKLPGYGAVIFRRTSPQITNEGGLWDESEKLYPLAGGKPRVHVHDWKFPSGATISFKHLQHDKDRLAWQGAQVAVIGFDELTHFSADQFWYLLSRNRSTCGVKPRIRATCNPDPDSFVAHLLAWWIDPATGQAIPERAGKLRWFVRVNDRLHWADTAEQLQEQFPNIPPKSLSFVPARLSDNQVLCRADPGYLANLLALPLVERERLLGGNWLVRPAAGRVFNRAWFDIVEASPVVARRVRYWDKAGTQDGGHWTAGVRMATDGSGVYWVEDVIRGQWSSHERNRVIKQTAQLDGEDCEIDLEQEPGSSGKESAEISIRELAGYIVHAERVTGDKLTRARQLSAQCEARNVKLVRGSWNETYLVELHRFDGKGGSDDQVDGSSGAFNKLATVYSGEWSADDNPAAASQMSRAPEEW